MTQNLLDELLEIDSSAVTATTNNSSSEVAVYAARSDIIVPDPIEVPDATPRSPQEDDIAFARRKMRIIIKAAESAFNELAIVANETQQPRAYEVLATLLKTATDATKELIRPLIIKEIRISLKSIRILSKLCLWELPQKCWIG